MHCSVATLYLGTKWSGASTTWGQKPWRVLQSFTFLHLAKLSGRSDIRGLPRSCKLFTKARLIKSHHQPTPPSLPPLIIFYQIWRKNKPTRNINNQTKESIPHLFPYFYFLFFILYRYLHPPWRLRCCCWTSRWWGWPRPHPRTRPGSWRGRGTTSVSESVL